jgi:Lon protease-like protein
VRAAFLCGARCGRSKCAAKMRGGDVTLWGGQGVTLWGKRLVGCAQAERQQRADGWVLEKEFLRAWSTAVEAPEEIAQHCPQAKQTPGTKLLQLTCFTSTKALALLNLRDAHRDGA